MNIQYNLSLLPYNTFAVDVKCSQLITLEQEEEIQSLFQEKIIQRKFLILGYGSNILFTQDFNGVVIQLKTKGIGKIKETEEEVYLRVATGELWDDFIQYCMDNTYSGVENLAGIPGLVGSSPVQNIGAYGVEAKDTIHSVKGYFVQSEKAFEFSNTDCEFAYRSSIFKTNLKNQCLITHVVFRLSKKENYNIKYKALDDYFKKNNLTVSLNNIAEAVVNIRNSKLPKVGEIGSAGSFFQNPIVLRSHYQKLLEKHPNLIAYEMGDEKVKLAAGQLIDLLGWKGKRIGDAGVYPLQALVLVNYGKAKGKEIVDIAKQIQSDIYNHFGVELQSEVNII